MWIVILNLSLLTHKEVKLILVVDGIVYWRVYRAAVVQGVSAWYDRLHPSDNKQLVVLALRAMAHPFRHHLPHRASTAQRQSRSVRVGRPGRRLRRGASVPVEPRAALPLPASLARDAAQPPDVLPNGCAALSHGSRRSTVCQGRSARLSGVSQVFSQTSVWLTVLFAVIFVNPVNGLYHFRAMHMHKMHTHGVTYLRPVMEVDFSCVLSISWSCSTVAVVG